MFYLNIQTAEQRIAILEIIDLFTEHELFLDCAISTLALLMQQRFKIETYYAPLCTSWDYSKVRKNPEMLVNRCLRIKDAKFELFHPMKISKINNWSKYSNQLLSI